MSALGVGVIVIGLLASRPTQLKSAEIDLTHTGSHRELLNVFSNHTDRAYREILTIFDNAVAAHPANSQPLIEKCQFISAAFPGSDEDGPIRQQDLDAAKSELERRFPLDPEATLFLANQRYGPSQIEFLARYTDLALVRWSDAQRARRLEMLAWARYHANTLVAARSDAEEAMRLNPNLDLTLIVASYFDSIKRPELAGRALLPKWNSSVEPWQKARKAHLLAASRHPSHAAKLFDSLGATSHFFYDPLEYAEVLEQVNRLAAARQQLVKVAARQWKAESARRRLFDFDLRHGDENAAVKSYREYCAEGIKWDSLLRRRLALFLAFPNAPWTGADLARLGLLLGAVALLSVVPLVLVWPVHYIGLWRQVKGTVAPGDRAGWSLKDLWWISAVWLCASFAAVYWFQYDEFAANFDKTEGVELTLNEARLAPAALTSAVGFWVGVLLVLRRRHWQLAFQNGWSARRTLGIIFVLFIFVRIVARFSGHVAAFINDGEFPDMAGVSVRLNMILSIGKTYGPAALFLFVVIMAPWAEEFAYRGVMLDSLQRHLPFHLANLIQATAFGLVHEDAVLFVYFAFFGWLAGLMRRETGGLAVPLLFHAANNSMAYLSMLRYLS